MSYVKIDDHEFLTIEEAAIYAEDNKKPSAAIEIYNVFGNYVETQEISAAEGYKYYAYAIFEMSGTADENFELWDWYKGYETFYNTIEECIWELESAHIGKYKIAAIYQNQSSYLEDRDVKIIEITMQIKDLTTV